MGGHVGRRTHHVVGLLLRHALALHRAAEAAAGAPFDRVAAIDAAEGGAITQFADAFGAAARPVGAWLAGANGVVLDANGVGEVAQDALFAVVPCLGGGKRAEHDGGDEHLTTKGHFTTILLGG